MGSRSQSTLEWIVSERESGIKLVAFLKEKTGNQFSSRQLKRAIEGNLCQVNNRIERFASAILGNGDNVRLDTGSITDVTTSKAAQDVFPILYQDEVLLLIDKPAGISSESPDLLANLKLDMPFLELLHRLDRDTTGVLAFAKSPKAVQIMLQLFKERKIKKEYLAIVDGIPTTKAGTITNYLGKLHAYQGQTLWGKVPKEKGSEATTDWKMLKHGNTAALISCEPLTGRTHQIRIHLSDLGHPILGDKQYGKRFHCPYRPARCLLHAKQLSFNHPISQEKMNIQAPLPDDFTKALNELAML